MRLRQMRGEGFPCWPPVWLEKILSNSEEGVLKQVVLVPGTTILKVDVRREDGDLIGLLIFEKEFLDSVYQKLQANIGRTLTEVGNLEINY